jgi:hypothetical protein
MKDPEAPAHEFLKTHAIAGKTSARVVKMIVASMLRDGWRGAPIAVVVHGNDKYILDGHHRRLLLVAPIFRCATESFRKKS